MESGAVELGILPPTGLESPLLPGLLIYEPLQEASRKAVVSRLESTPTVRGERSQRIPLPRNSNSTQTFSSISKEDDVFAVRQLAAPLVSLIVREPSGNTQLANNTLSSLETTETFSSATNDDQDAFAGTSPPVANSSSILILEKDEQAFRWISSDPILGDIDTGLVEATRWMTIGGDATRPERLIFQGLSDDGEFLSGNVLFNNYNRAVVDIRKGNQRIRYLLTTEGLNIDLDIDSDNNSQSNPDGTEADPARSAEEDSIEDDATKIGKKIRLNNKDFDSDGIPDFADGFNLDKQPGNNDDLISLSQQKKASFTPLIFEIPQSVDPTKAKVRFSYSASDPAAVRPPDGNNNEYQLPPGGNLRIWTLDAWQQRNPASLANGGNYVAPNTEYGIAQLGNPIQGNGRTWRFFVEGTAIINPPVPQQIKVELDPLGDGSWLREDVVRVKVIEGQECPDTTPLRVELVGGEFADIDGDGDCDGRGTILIGRTDGIATMLRIENAVAEFDDKNFRLLSGIVYSTIGNVAGPLFQGNFEIPYNTATTTSFQETGNVPNEYQLAGLDVNFKKLQVNPNNIALEGRFVLPNVIGGFPIDLNVPNTLLITQNEVEFAGGKVDFPNQEFSLFNWFTIETADASIEYQPIEDLLKIQGKLTLKEPFFKFLGDKVKLVLDVSDKNYIQIKKGVTDVKGSISVKDVKLPGNWGLSELSVNIKTEDGNLREIGGKAKVKFPWPSPSIPPKGKEAGLELGFILPPIQLNSIGIELDSLNIPIGTTGVFLQRIEGRVNNIAKTAPPIEFGRGVGLTYGPEISIDLPDFLGLGNIEGSLIRLDANATVSSQQLSGELKIVIINNKLVEAKGGGYYNWNKDVVGAETSVKLLGGIITGANKFTADFQQKFVNASGSVSLQFPDSRFFWVLRGRKLASANSLLNFTNDGNYSNDLIAGWGNLNIPFYGSITAGLKVFFDGNVDLIVGAKDVPKTNSFDVKPGTQYLLLTADWDNTASGVTVRVKDPNGNWIEEADFAAHQIAVVGDLTSLYARSVVINTPMSGNWDLQVVDPTGLGEVRILGFRDSVAPTIEITAPTVDVIDEPVTITYNAFDADSEAKISLFYDNDSQGNDGILITGGLAETDGSGSFVWNTEGIPTGSYFVYAMIEDENNAPIFSEYSVGKVQVAKAADLSVTQTANTESVDVGNQLTYTVEVTNNGLDISKGVLLTETLPEDATFVSATLTPTSQSGNVLEFNLGDLANGQNSTLNITFVAPTILGTMTGSASLSSKNYDPDKTNNLVLLDSTVTNTQSLPEIAINDVSLEEGETGITEFVFTVSLSKSITETVKVNYTTVDDTATSDENAPSGKDYTATSGTLEFAPGETEKTIAVPVIGDPVLEPNETFFVNLSHATQAAILDSQGLGTIKDKLSLLIDDVTLPEDDSGSTNAVFTVRLSAASTEAVMVDYTTVDETATAGEDYTTTSGKLEFAPGETEKTIAVPVIGDTVVEEDETFLVQLSNATGAELLDPQGKGTIENNEIVGTDSNDILLGTNGDDNIQGFGGDDLLLGQGGNDILSGGDGNDTLTAGNGNDTLTGGTGGDRFVFNSITEGIDTITDWESGGSDQIKVSATGFGSGLMADASLLESQFVLGTSAGNADHRFIYDDSTGNLFFDPDGNSIGGAPQQQIATLTDAHLLSASDIFVF